MALDSTRWGMNVGNALRAWSMANVPQNSFITDSQLIEAWQVITGEHQTEVNDNADLEFMTADLSVNPGTFRDSLNQPITGLGLTNAATLMQRIK